MSVTLVAEEEDDCEAMSIHNPTKVIEDLSSPSQAMVDGESTKLSAIEEPLTFEQTTVAVMVIPVVSELIPWEAPFEGLVDRHSLTTTSVSLY